MLASAVVIALLVLATASSGAIFKPGEWYDKLEKPAWTPPDWMFPLVWTVLYLVIGYAGWLTWQNDNGLLFTLWLFQLALNAVWSWLFFGIRKMRLAFLDLCAMFFLIVVFILLGLQTVPLAAWLFIPYAAWVLTAGVLNWQVMKLNPGH